MVLLLLPVWLVWLTLCAATSRKPVDIQLVDIPTAAERLSISVRGVRRLVERGDLFSVRVGDRRRLIPSYAVDEYIRSRIAVAEDRTA